MSIGLILGFIALFGLWFLLRLTLFFSDRIGSVTMPQDLYPICTWLLRAILIIIAVSVAVIALPGALFGIAMGDAFGPRKVFSVKRLMFFSEGGCFCSFRVGFC